MKKILYALLISITLLLTANQTKAQAWERHSKVLGLGFGASQFFHLDDYYYGRDFDGHPLNGRGWYWPVTGQINFQGEFGIHKYVGLGFTTGFGGRGGMRYGYTGEVNVPIGLICNFHFYQLIADKKPGKNIHADKLDIYVGASIGSGVAASFYNDYVYGGPTVVRIAPIAFGGLHAGVRYYFKPKVGVNLELGFGKSLINAGFVFKI
jgi:hypothetical protein